MFCTRTLLIGLPESTTAVHEKCKVLYNLSLNNDTEIVKSIIKNSSRKTINCHKDSLSISNYILSTHAVGMKKAKHSLLKWVREDRTIGAFAKFFGKSFIRLRATCCNLSLHNRKRLVTTIICDTKLVSMQGTIRQNFDKSRAFPTT